jgi:hypothetical protein
MKHTVVALVEKRRRERHEHQEVIGRAADRSEAVR